MDRDVTLYQITSVMAERVFQKIDNFIKAVEKMRDFMQSVFPLLIVRIMLYGVYFRIILTLLCLFSRWQLHLMMRRACFSVFAELQCPAESEG